MSCRASEHNLFQGGAKRSKQNKKKTIKTQPQVNINTQMMKINEHASATRSSAVKSVEGGLRMKPLVILSVSHPLMPLQLHI